MEIYGIGEIKPYRDEIEKLKSACAALRQDNDRLKNNWGSLNSSFEKAIVLKDQDVSAKKRLFDRSIVVKCPFCDFAVTLPLVSIPDVIQVSEVLNDHLCADHWMLELPNITEARIERAKFQSTYKNGTPARAIMEICKHCNFNYLKLRQKEQKMEALKIEYDAMCQELSWVFHGENADSVSYTGYNSDASLFDIFHVKKVHIAGIANKIETGNYVYADGAKYPVSLIDFIHSHQKKGKAGNFSAFEPSVLLENVEKSESVYTTLTENNEKILEFIRLKPACSHSEISKGLELSKSTVSDSLKKLEEMKLVKKNNEGNFSVVQPE